MANNHFTQNSILVAIDVAKRSHDILIQWPNGKSRIYKVPNTKQGQIELIEFLSPQKNSVYAALEPTADYHRPIAYALADAGVNVHLASSLTCARVREAIYNSWDKHDRKDAKVIMYLLEKGMTKPFHDPLLAGYLDVQELSNAYHQISITRTRCQNSLVNHYLTLFFPEMERFLNSTRAEWFCRFLLRFPTPASIVKFDLKSFSTKAWELVGRKVNKEGFLAEIYETARNSMGLPVSENGLAIHTFRMQVQRYLDLTQQRNALEKLAEQNFRGHEDYHRLRTLPGIGPIIALIIIAESGDLRRFAHHRQYLKYCGFNLSAKQSGNTKSAYRLSKRGNSRLRYAYWLAATVAIRQRENSFRAKYERYIVKDPKNKNLCRKAYTAVAVKMARVAHALIKNNTTYRGYYEAAIPGARTTLTGP